MSVNQLPIYHIILETYNITRNLASEQIQTKSTETEKKYSLRSLANHDLKVPEKPNSKCVGFSYFGAKIFNKLPRAIKETKNSANFKTMIKVWIWNHIPSY